jgi:hypothetical protein
MRAEALGGMAASDIANKMVADAVGCEPVSATKFPAIRENNRESCEIAARGAGPASYFDVKFKDLQANSLLCRAGNFQNRKREF